MRNYATISPMFWIRGSGKALRGKPEAQLVALYLMTCAASEMVGIYHMHADIIARETGLSAEATTNGLDECRRHGIAFYDDEAELVWIPALARYQIGESLGAGKSGKADKRIAGIARAIAPYKGHPFHEKFLDRYGEAYSLFELGGVEKPHQRPLEAPSDGLERGFCDSGSPLVPVPVPVPAGGDGGGEQHQLAPDWDPGSAVLAGSGVADWAHPVLLAEFRAYHLNAKTERDATNWRQSYVKRAMRIWQDPKRRPKRPPGEAEREAARRREEQLKADAQAERQRQRDRILAEGHGA